MQFVHFVALHCREFNCRFEVVVDEVHFLALHCREFNCKFEVTVDELLVNPMMVTIFERMRSSGETDCKQKVASAITAQAQDSNYIKSDGKLLFPTNVAVIATAHA